MSMHPEIVDVSQDGPSGPPTVQIEMASPQTGLRNRVRQIPDGLAHLNSGGINDRSTDASNLRSIAFALLRLDAWALETFKYATFVNDRSREIYEEFKVVVSNQVKSLTHHKFQYENIFENEIQRILDKLSDEEILEILCNLQTSTYYAQFIQLRTSVYIIMATEHKYATNTSIASNLTVPKDLKHLETPQSYLRYLTRQSSDTKLRLRSVVMGCRDLRDRIKHAAELREIPLKALGALKKKIEALQLNYRDACTEVGIDSHNLIDPTLLQWWDPGDDAPRAHGLNTPTSKAVEAYPHSRSVIATLSFLVPTICLLSCIPAGLAWSHTPSTIGAYNDGNFYQLLSSSAMQLLGIGTLIWPTLFSTRLSRTSWIWTCVLTGMGIICTVVSVPLYLYAPTAWSGLLSFCGNVAQTLVLLQLVQSF